MQQREIKVDVKDDHQFFGMQNVYSEQDKVYWFTSIPKDIVSFGCEI